MGGRRHRLRSSFRSKEVPWLNLFQCMLWYSYEYELHNMINCLDMAPGANLGWQRFFAWKLPHRPFCSRFQGVDVPCIPVLVITDDFKTLALALLVILSPLNARHVWPSGSPNANASKHVRGNLW